MGLISPRSLVQFQPVLPFLCKKSWRDAKFLWYIRHDKDLSRATNKPNQSKLCFGLFGTPDTIRTCDLQFRKLTLYPAELRVRDKNDIPDRIMNNPAPVTNMSY